METVNPENNYSMEADAIDGLILNNPKDKIVYRKKKIKFHIPGISYSRWSLFL